MANQRPGGVAPPRIGFEPVARTGGLDVAPPNPGGPARSVAQDLAQLSNALGQRADAAAVQAGTEAGREAGADLDRATLKGGTGLFSRAYDQALRETAAAGVETSLRTAFAQAWAESESDPAGWAARADAIEAAHLGAVQKRDPALARDLALVARNARQKFDVDAAEGVAKQARVQLQAANDGIIQARTQDAIAAARAAPPGEAGDAVIAAEHAASLAAIIRNGPVGAFELNGRSYPADPTRSGAYTVAEIAEADRRLRRDLETERVVGVFARLPSVAAKEAFVRDLAAETAKGEGPLTGLGPTYADAALNRLRNELNLDRADQAGEAEAVRFELKQLDQALRAGLAPRPDAVAQLRARASALGDPQLTAELDVMDTVAGIAPRLAAMSPAQLAAFTDAARARLGQTGASPAEAAVIGLAEDLYRIGMASLRAGTADYIDGRGAGAGWGGGSGGGGGGRRSDGGSGEDDGAPDGVTAAALPGGIGQLLITPGRVGRAKLPALVINPEDPGALTRQLSQRIGRINEQARQAGAVPTGYLLGAEETAFRDVLKAGGRPAQALASAILASGPDGQRILNDLSREDGGAMAYGYALGAVSPEAGRRVASGQRLAAQGMAASAPADKAAQKIFDQEIADAYRASPDMRGRIRDAAQRIYTDLTAGRPEADTLDDAQWRRAIRLATGQTQDRGGAWGGVAVKDGARVAAPDFVRADQFASIWRSLTAEDFASWGIPVERRAWNGTVTARGFDLGVLRGARPVALSNGRYMIEVPGRGFLQRTDGGTYVVNFNQRRNVLARRHPGAVR